MLMHSVIGPYEDGEYLVVYPTPGCNVMTVACPCRTEGQAAEVASRLNQKQIFREMDIRRDRELRGLGGVYPALSDNK